MNIYSRRILDSSENLSTPISIRNTYNNVKYIQFNTNIKKINSQNSKSNIKIKAPRNLIPKPINSNYHSIIKKYNKYTISEPNLNNDISYKKIKESSKRLQNRLDKLINHSKEVKLENERNKIIRNEFFNRNYSSQRTGSTDLSSKLDEILNGKNSIISTFKKLNNIITDDFSQNNSKRKKIKKSVSVIKKNSNPYILKKNNLKDDENYDLNELNDLSHLADDFLNAFDLNIKEIKNKNNVKEKKEEDNKKEIGNNNNNLKEDNENKKNEENSKLINEKNDTSNDNKIENSILSNDKLNTPLRDYNFNLEDYGIYKENVYFRNEIDFLKANYDTDANYNFRPINDNSNEKENDLSDNYIKNNNELELKNILDENIKKNNFGNNILDSNDKDIDINLIKKNEISMISENKDSNEKQIKNPFKESINMFTFEQNNEIDEKEKNNKEINDKDDIKNQNLIEEHNLLESDSLKDKKIDKVQKVKTKNKVKNPFINDEEINIENEINNLSYSSDDEYNIDIIEQNNKEKGRNIDTNELKLNIKNLNLSEEIITENK